MIDDKRFRLPFVVPLLVLGALVAVPLFFALRGGPSPQVTIEPAMKGIGRRTPITIRVAEPSRGVSRYKVELVQGDRIEALAERSFEHRSVLQPWGARTASDEIRVEVGRDTLRGLKSGEATIRVTAERVGSWLRHPDPVVAAVQLPVRLTPPSLELRSTQVYAAQGGCEVVVYRVGPTSARDGVRAGEWWFPGFALPGGGEQDRFALFAVPYTMGQPDIRLVAADDVGNESELQFIEKFFPKPFRTDTIEVTEGFMNKVVPEIVAQTPDFQDRGGLLENYLAINGGLRRRNAEELKALARDSAPQFLWTKPFLMMPNAKVMSAFADRRTYVHNGRDVDRQDHLGFDLAVTRRAPVAAANGGRVVLAKYLGIYGNAIVIDHGFGLMSLYGHLASIGVGSGQQVRRGDVLGATGETGLAGGDHLHFTMLLAGLAVNPIEWWDAHWIGDRIARKLGPSFRFEP